MDFDELTEYVKGLGQPAFRAKQLYEWMHIKLAGSYDEMSNIPAALRDFLKENTDYTALETVRVQTSREDGTSKYLFRLCDGNLIESVLMHYHHGNSVCISSQAGCRMGCRFCASTLDGLARSLSPSEMLDQIYRIQKSSGERVSNVVVMGSGEPFDNFDSLIKFEKLLTDENGLNISARNLTVSTCGLVPNIYRLADMQLQLTLAISLHAPNDDRQNRTQSHIRVQPCKRRKRQRKLRHGACRPCKGLELPYQSDSRKSHKRKGFSPVGACRCEQIQKHTGEKTYKRDSKKGNGQGHRRRLRAAQEAVHGDRISKINKSVKNRDTYC